MNILHSSSSNEWFTPRDIIDRVYQVLGEIDLDPASCPEANLVVEAKNFFTKEINGLTQEWHGKVFCNPPGNKTKNKSNTVLFWQKLINEVSAGHIEEAIFMAFSIEALQTTQRATKSIGEYTSVIPSKRLQFDRPQNQVNNQAPSHSNMIAYIPGKVNNTQKFIEVFKDLGVIINA